MCRLPKVILVPFLWFPTSVTFQPIHNRQFHVSLSSTHWAIVLLLHITVLGHALFLLQFILLPVVFLELVLWVARRGPRAQRFRSQRLFLLSAGLAKWTVFLSSWKINTFIREGGLIEVLHNYEKVYIVHFFRPWLWTGQCIQALYPEKICLRQKSEKTHLL